MRERISYLAMILLIMLLIPAGVILLFSDGQKLEAEKDPELEDYLAGIVYSQIPDSDFPWEAVKAQAVLARSSLIYELEKGNVSEEDWKQEASQLRSEMKSRKFGGRYRRVQMAVSETADEVLSYQGEVCQGIFHRVSAGYTRAGSDVFEGSGYEYITGVESVVDQESEDYLTGHYFTPDFLEKECLNFGIKLSFSTGDEIVVKTRDEAGYAATVEVGDTVCTGEEVRQMLHLPSASFTVEVQKKKIRFLCRGQGHGMGMSQYGAGRMAEEGSTYRDILNYYFPETEILVMESE
ncbi:MAG: SpoIID/LytB domain-containing protein [Ruminococcus sp.]|jgi:stage II sporulation protein D